MNKIFLKNSFWLMLALTSFKSVYGADHNAKRFKCTVEGCGAAFA